MQPGSCVYLRWRPWAPTDAAAAWLKAEGWDVTTVERGGKGWQGAVVEALDRVRPALFLTRQRLHAKWCGPVIEALDRLGTVRVHVDCGLAVGRAHWGDVSWWDPLGDNAVSSLVGSLDRLLADPDERAAIDGAYDHAAAFADQVWRLALGTPADLIRAHGVDPGVTGFVFAGLQRTGDGSLRFDGAGTPTPLELGRGLIARCRVENRPIVVKAHPMDRACGPLAELHDPAAGVYVVPSLPLNDGNDRLNAWLCANASVFIAINSTLLYQAMALGTPIVALGRGWFSGSGVVDEQTGRGPDRIDLDVVPPPVARRRLFMQLILSRQVDLDGGKAVADGSQAERLLGRFARLQGASLVG